MTAAKKQEYVSELNRLCQERGVKCNAWGGERSKDAQGWEHFAWRVTLWYAKRTLETTFRTGTGHVRPAPEWIGGKRQPRIPVPPSAADVLHCLCSDARAGEATFADFCTDFGYDTDSRKALEIYLNCQAEGPKLRTLLGADFDIFANAEH